MTDIVDVITGPVEVVEMLNGGMVGARGPAGLPGAGIVPRGGWDVGTHYAAGDAVSLAGTSYVAVRAGVGESPDIAPAAWMVISEHGQDGAPGEPGPAGPGGDPGLTGDRGPAGADGADGVDGAAGADGAAGDTGAQGPKGDTGAQGSTGSTGAQGPKGDTGSAGSTGSAGATGSQGPKGDTGDTGAAGAAGAAGAKGDIGATGAAGDKGDKGDTGSTGSAGSTGATGATGADGKTVLYGTVAPTTEGHDGDFYIRTTTNYIYGPKATTWPAGTSLVGPQGAAGANGTNGTNGTNGVSVKVAQSGVSLGTQSAGQSAFTWYTVGSVCARGLIVRFTVTATASTTWDLEVRGAGSGSGTEMLQALGLGVTTYSITVPWFYENDAAGQDLFVGIKNYGTSAATFALSTLQIEKFA